MFSTHEVLAPLKPHFLSYASKLTKMSETDCDIEILGVENYSKSVISRAVALQNGFETLKISTEYLGKNQFSPSEFDFNEHYTYHLESFYLTLFSIIDRCYLLVGTSILLKDKDIECINGKGAIEKALKKLVQLPNLLKSIKSLNKNAKEFKKTRHQIAHIKGYSNDHLELLSYLQIAPNISSILSTNQTAEKIEVTLKDGLIKKTNESIKKTTSILENDINNIFSELSIIYSNIDELYKVMNRS